MVLNKNFVWHLPPYPVFDYHKTPQTKGQLIVLAKIVLFLLFRTTYEVLS